MDVVMIYKYGKRFRYAPSFNYINIVNIKGCILFFHSKQAGWDKSPSSKYLHVPPGLTYEHEGGFQWHARRPSID